MFINKAKTALFTMTIQSGSLTRADGRRYWLGIASRYAARRSLTDKLITSTLLPPNFFCSRGTVSNDRLKVMQMQVRPSRHVIIKSGFDHYDKSDKNH